MSEKLLLKEEDSKFSMRCSLFETSPITDTLKNRYLMVIILRLFKFLNGANVFEFREISKLLGSTNKQASHWHYNKFNNCNEEFQKYLDPPDRNKISQAVINETLNIIKENPLISERKLKEKLNENRKEKIGEKRLKKILYNLPYGSIKEEINKFLKLGKISYKEDNLLKELIRKNSNENLSLFDISFTEVFPTGMKLSDPSKIKKLLTPNFPIEKIDCNHKYIFFMMSLYHYGLPLSVLKEWFNLSKSTILRYIIILSLSLYQIVYGKILNKIKVKKCYCDEKWIKIRKKWYYWFVFIDIESGIPIFESLQSSTSLITCEWILTELQKLGIKLNLLLTDGLVSYKGLENKFKGLKHRCCIFHFQKSILSWLRNNIKDKKKIPELKRKMQYIFKSNNRTKIRERYNKLKLQSKELGINKWFEMLDDGKFEKLLLSIKNKSHPKTTNEIERFFRKFNRFYKIKYGFSTVLSCKRSLKYYMFMYLFLKNSKGVAPIEKIIPEIVETPAYKILNNPMKYVFKLDFENENKIKFEKNTEQKLLNAA